MSPTANVAAPNSAAYGAASPSGAMANPASILNRKSARTPGLRHIICAPAPLNARDHRLFTDDVASAAARRWRTPAQTNVAAAANPTASSTVRIDQPDNEATAREPGELRRLDGDVANGQAGDVPLALEDGRQQRELRSPKGAAGGGEHNDQPADERHCRARDRHQGGHDHTDHVADDHHGPP